MKDEKKKPEKKSPKHNEEKLSPKDWEEIMGMNRQILHKKMGSGLEDKFGGATMDEIREVVIDSEEIKDFFFRELIRRGYVPDENELEELADICFDYLIDIGVIDEEDEEAE